MAMLRLLTHFGCLFALKLVQLRLLRRDVFTLLASVLIHEAFCCRQGLTLDITTGRPCQAGIGTCVNM